MSQYFLYVLKYSGDKYGVRRSSFGHFFGRSKNHLKKKIAIDQESWISHFWIIENTQTPPHYIKNKEKQTNLFVCRILDPLQMLS